MKHIEKTMAMNELKKREQVREEVIKSYLDKLELLEKILDAEYEKITFFFSEYTDHGWKHTIKVLEYMFELLDDPADFSDEEIMLIIYAALLHDIGMACDETDVKELGLVQDSLLESKIVQYKRANPKCPDNSVEKNYLMDILRGKHGIFSKNKIEEISERNMPESCASLFKFSMGGGSKAVNNWDATQIIAMICRSHMEATNWVEEQFHGQNNYIFIACLLRLADLIDVDIDRANVFYQTSRHIHGISNEHYTLNQMFCNPDRIQNCSATCREKCPNREDNRLCEKRYKKIKLVIVPPDMKNNTHVINMTREFIDTLEAEIEDVENILKKLPEKYHIRLRTEVEYTMDTGLPFISGSLDSHKLSVDYSAIKDLFSGDQIYNDNEIGLREIIQNAYDACKAFGGLEHNENDWEAKITITLNTTEQTLSIRDNGIGMTKFEIKEYFLNIGKSIYNCKPSYIYDDYHTDHIGHFGLGFYATFLLSEKVKLETQSYASANATIIELDKKSNFATLTYNTSPMGHGTEVILNLDDVQNSLKTKNIDDFIEYLQSYIYETFLADGISLRLVIVGVNKSDKDGFEMVSLPINNWSIVNDYFNRIQASVNISSKVFPKIYFFEGQADFNLVEYDDLLMNLAKKYRSMEKVPYLDAGDFLIFPSSDAVYKAFLEKANGDAHTNYSSGTLVCECASKKINEFCNENGIQIPRHCNYHVLSIIVEGNNSALCETNIPCAKKGHSMRINDACGVAQLDDKIYLRDVLLPKLHITLPYINFRYNFDGFIANIKTDDIFPTLQRETLTNEKVKELSVAVGYALSKLRADTGEAKIEDDLIISKHYKDISGNIFIK